MAVYVDDMYKHSIGAFMNMKMSHLIADTKEELIDMVNKIKVQRKWIQDKDTYLEHFDICMSKRELAIKAGAIPITWRQLGEMVAKRKKSV